MTNESVKKPLVKVMRNIITGILMVGAAAFMYSGTAQAHYYYPMYNVNGTIYQGEEPQIWDVHKSVKCFNSPENRCFLVVDFMHSYPYPFFQKMDSGYWYHGHYYTYYHRYYDRVYNSEYGNCYHTVYYYSYGYNNRDWDMDYDD